MSLSFSEDYIAKIRRMFGLNLYEAKVWLALLSQGKSTSGKLSEIANIPKSRAYDILVSLENGGFIVRDLSKPISYRAIPPKELIEKLEEKAKDSLNQKLDKLNKLKESAVLNDLQSLYNKGIKYVDENKVANSYQGLDSIYFRIKKSINSAKGEVIIVTTENSLERKISALGRALKKAKANNVTVHIYAPVKDVNETILNEIKQFGKLNKTDIDIGRFIIVDGNEIFIFTENDEETHPSNEVVLHIKGKYMPEKIKKLVSSHVVG
jgi:sugar-specific transcriptional regulator TrmB